MSKGRKLSNENVEKVKKILSMRNKRASKQMLEARNEIKDEINELINRISKGNSRIERKIKEVLKISKIRINSNKAISVLYQMSTIDRRSIYYSLDTFLIMKDEIDSSKNPWNYFLAIANNVYKDEQKKYKTSKSDIDIYVRMLENENKNEENN